MKTTRCFGVLLLSAGLVTGLFPTPGLAGRRSPIGDSISFADGEARQRFASYVRFLEQDPEKFADELATLCQLASSDVEYQVRIGGSFRPGSEGMLTTDGTRILISILPARGADRQVASLNARLAHEFEHARQFDTGELAFARDPQTGRWYPDPASYDIGDEVKAWAAQVKVAVPNDFWIVRNGARRASRLRAFADARTHGGRARVLLEYAYREVCPVSNCHVVVSPKVGYSAGQLLRPDRQRNFFGRVYRVSRASTA